MDKKLKRNLMISVFLLVLVYFIGFLRLKTSIFNGIDSFALNFFKNLKSPELDLFMKLVTQMGDEIFLMFFGVALYWIGYREGIVFAGVMIFSQVFTYLNKEFFMLKRPFGAEEIGFGYPSAHTQGGALTFGFLQYFKKSIFLWIPPILIGVSRIYLQVHYFSDVLGGFIQGIAFSYLVLLLIGYLKEKNFSIRQKIFFSFVFTLFVLVFGYRWQYWSRVSGLTLGIFLSYSFIKGKWRVRGKKILGIVFFGGATVFMLRLGLKLLFPPSFDFFTYFLIGVWIVWYPKFLARFNSLGRFV